MAQHRYFQSVIGPLNKGLRPLKLHFILFFFNYTFNRALINRSGAMARHRYFHSVIGPLNRGSIP